MHGVAHPLDEHDPQEIISNVANVISIVASVSGSAPEALELLGNLKHGSKVLFFLFKSLEHALLTANALIKEKRAAARSATGPRAA